RGERPGKGHASGAAFRCKCSRAPPAWATSDRRPAEQGAVNRQAGLPFAPFEVSTIVEVVLGRRLVDLFGPYQHREIPHQLEGCVEVLFDVSPEVQQAVGLEGSRDVGKKLPRKYAAFAMPLLPPGIREVDMYRVE